MIVLKKFSNGSSSRPYGSEGPVLGFSVRVPVVASKETFSLSSFGDDCWWPPCSNCVELLTHAGYPPYDMFPHRGRYLGEEILL
jgi:hypothetical protein